MVYVDVIVVVGAVDGDGDVADGEAGEEDA